MITRYRSTLQAEMMRTQRLVHQASREAILQITAPGEDSWKGGYPIDIERILGVGDVAEQSNRNCAASIGCKNLHPN
ncbi:hypothetical protein Leryth_017039 [Lithospermum erythrorhizon]|nr:hypothetical protein Leryth_017039 [Lithospermum erythrorhizon]